MHDVMQTFFGFSSVPRIVRGYEFLTVNFVLFFSAYSLKLEKVWSKKINK